LKFRVIGLSLAPSEPSGRHLFEVQAPSFALGSDPWYATHVGTLLGEQNWIESLIRASATLPSPPYPIPAERRGDHATVSAEARLLLRRTI
jgi:hypothetical protein